MYRTLYQRWSGREGGVTNRWKSLNPAIIKSDIIQVATSIEATLKQFVPDGAERDILRYATGLLLHRQFHRDEISNGYRLDLGEIGLFNIDLSHQHRSHFENVLPNYRSTLLQLELDVRALKKQTSVDQ